MVYRFFCEWGFVLGVYEKKNEKLNLSSFESLKYFLRFKIIFNIKIEVNQSVSLSLSKTLHFNNPAFEKLKLTTKYFKGTNSK